MKFGFSYVEEACTKGSDDESKIGQHCMGE